jgi:hypothetical protein
MVGSTGEDREGWEGIDRIVGILSVGIRLLVVDSCLGDEEIGWAIASPMIDKTARKVMDKLKIGLLVENR